MGTLTRSLRVVLCLVSLLVASALRISASDAKAQYFIDIRQCGSAGDCGSEPRSLLVLYSDKRFAVLTTYFDKGQDGTLSFQPGEGCVVRWGRWKSNGPHLIAQNKGKWAHMAVGKPTVQLSRARMQWTVQRDAAGVMSVIEDGEHHFERAKLDNPTDVDSFFQTALRESEKKK